MKKLLGTALALTMFFTMNSSAFATTPQEIASQNVSTTVDLPTSFSETLSTHVSIDPSESTESTSSIDNSTTVDLPTSFSETLSTPISIAPTENKTESEIEPLSNLVLININHDYSYDASKLEHRHTFNIDAPGTLINPPVDAVFKIMRSDTQYGTYTEVKRLAVSNASYITDHVVSIPRRTGHYKAVIELYPRRTTDFIASPVEGSSKLINKTGNLWIFIFSDSTSGKSLERPPANYVKGYLHDRISNLNTVYKNWYDSTYPNADLNLSLYDIHHIKPLEYGGSNAMSNLIHLPKALHGSVSGWFNGY
ncbi:HNH endonuclease signature motif containing protein [Paenibacillus sp. FSL H7-0326]|uniref:HNH endonuclease signature motif containing protein n=1 Tax=Paenibacillus sp. FSL H7-0326 TaxID=1921144 RepID=UPI001C4CE960|nr:HNH endonuclease signature motif containing protein [Paenibacillus sp. FSL H7-0326]